MLIIVVAVLSIIVGVLIVSTARPRSAAGSGPVVAAIAAMAIALLLVGVVSNTFIRHVVQIVPLLLVLLLAVGRRDWTAAAAAPLLAFWMIVMGAIWLFLLGIARFTSGTFTPAEIALTIVIGIAALAGIASARRQPRPGRLTSRIAVVVVFTLLQVGAMMISFLPAIARR